MKGSEQSGIRTEHFAIIYPKVKVGMARWVVILLIGLEVKTWRVGMSLGQKPCLEEKFLRLILMGPVCGWVTPKCGNSALMQGRSPV